VLRDDAGDGDVGAAKGVDDLALAQARGVVFEGELVFAGVDAEAAQAVGVGEFSQVGHLFGVERSLQLKSDFYEGHGQGLYQPLQVLKALSGWEFHAIRISRSADFCFR
jgi:hypothetical protein